jgi:copper transporter 1
LNLNFRPAPANFPSWPQQILRAAIYGTQFSGAFLVMLFGMYYNGYVLFAIFLGGFVGNALFSSDTVGCVGDLAKSESPCCC